MNALTLDALDALCPPLPSPATAAELARAAEALEMACWLEVLTPAEPSRRAPGLRALHNDWGLALVCEAADDPLLNRVLVRPPPDRESRREQLMELLAVHRRAGVERCFVHVHAADETALGGALAEAGLERYPRSWVKLACDVRGAGASRREIAPPADGVRVRPLGPADARAFAELFCAGFDMPAGALPLLEDLPGRARFFAWGAEIDGRLAGVGLLYRGARGAYLAGGVTAPEHRRRGVQRALLEARWQQALGLGARLVVSETGEEKPGQEQHSYRNLCRLGLAPVATRPNYRLRPSGAGG